MSRWKKKWTKKKRRREWKDQWLQSTKTQGFKNPPVTVSLTVSTDSKINRTCPSWRLGENNDGLLKQTLVVKYGIHRDEWDHPQQPEPRHSIVWRGILSIREDFNNLIRYHVDLGERIHFWLDTWVGTIFLGFSVPWPFSQCCWPIVCLQLVAFCLGSYFHKKSCGGRGGSIRCHPLSFVWGIHPEVGIDWRVYIGSVNDSFSVASFFSSLLRVSSASDSIDGI